MTRGLRWLVAVVLVAAAPASCGRTVAVPPAPLSVAGNLLVADGKRVVIRGASIYALPFYRDGNGADTALAAVTGRQFDQRERIFATMRAEGVNTVRIPISSEGYRGGDYGIPSQQAYVARLRALVASADGAGLRVVVGWWLSGPVSDDVLRRYPQLFPFMGAVVRALRAFPDVVYEPLNEPLGLSWPEWLTVMSGVLREWRLHLHYHGVLALDTIGYSWDFSASAATALMNLDASLLHGKPQVVFANHRYPNASDCFCGSEAQQWRQEIGSQVTRFPLLGTEYGVYDGVGPPGLRWMAQLLVELRTSAIPAGFNGAILFVWDWVDPNSLTSGNHLTAYGREAEDGLWSVADPPAPHADGH